MKILTEIKDSIYNPSYYKNLPTSQSLKASIKYLAKLCLFFALIGTILSAFSFPSFYKSTRDKIHSIAQDYPSDLVFTIKDGNASINQPEPYILPKSQVFKNLSEKDSSGNRENILVVDTTKPFSVQQFKSYSATAWVTKTELVMYRDATDRIEIIPLSRFGNREINKSWVLDKEIWFLQILPWLIPILIVLIFIFIFCIDFLGVLLTVLFYALIIWLISKIKKAGLTYKNSYKIGIHAATLTFLVARISALIRAPANINFFIGALVVVLIFYINYFGKPQKVEQKMP